MNGIVQFTLFQMGKLKSKVEQLEIRIVSWKFEVPLYLKVTTMRENIDTRRKHEDAIYSRNIL
jgi:hypothetical protein